MKSLNACYCTHMGVRRNFSRGGTVDISLILFQVANDAMQMDLHKTLYPFYTTKKIAHESTRSVRIFWNRIQVELNSSLRELYFLSSFTNFAELGYHPISLLLWTTGNWFWIGLEISTSLNWSWNIHNIIIIVNYKATESELVLKYKGLWIELESYGPPLTFCWGTGLYNFCFFGAPAFVVLKSTTGTGAMNSIPPNKSVYLSAKRDLHKAALEPN